MARVFGHYLQMVAGYAITTVGDPEQVFAAVAETRPTWMLAAPQTWDRLCLRLRDRLSGMADAVEAVTRRLALAHRGEWVSAELERTYEQADEQQLGAVRRELGLDKCDLLLIEPRSGAGHSGPPARARSSAGRVLGYTRDRRAGDDATARRRSGRKRRHRAARHRDPHRPGWRASRPRPAPDARVPRRARRTEVRVGPDGWLRTGRTAGMDEAGYVWLIGRRTNSVPRPRAVRRHP